MNEAVVLSIKWGIVLQDNITSTSGDYLNNCNVCQFLLLFYVFLNSFLIKTYRILLRNSCDKDGWVKSDFVLMQEYLKENLSTWVILKESYRKIID